VMIAEIEVEDARARLEAGIEAASTSGRRVLDQIKRQIKPIAVGLAIVGGVALLAGTVRLARGAFARSRLPRRDSPFAPPSLAKQVFGAALTSAAGVFASAAARRATQELGGQTQTENSSQP
jgi:heme A synthase